MENTEDKYYKVDPKNLKCDAETTVTKSGRQTKEWVNYNDSDKMRADFKNKIQEIIDNHDIKDGVFLAFDGKNMYANSCNINCDREVLYTRLLGGMVGQIYSKLLTATENKKMYADKMFEHISAFQDGFREELSELDEQAITNYVLSGEYESDRAKSEDEED